MLATAEAVEVKDTPPEAVFDELRRDLADWMTTNEDLVWRPAIELTEEEHEFAARALMPGVEPKEVEVFVTPERLLIKGETHGGPTGKRKVLSSIEFPRPINPRQVDAEITDGMLSVRAEIAEALQTNIFLPRAA